MANGRVAFHGAPATLERYCVENSLVLPAYTNPADFFVQLVNSDFADSASVEKVVSMWTITPKAHDDIPTPSSSTVPKRCQVQVFKQFSTLLRRQGLVSIRDTSLYAGRMLVFLVANTFMALIYWKSRPYNQEFVLPKFFLMGWLGGVPTMFSAVAVFAFNQHFIFMAK